MRTLFAVEPENEAGFEQLPDSLPAPFERIELKGELLDVASIRKRLFKPVRGLSLGVADVVPRELAHRVAEADLPVRLEFLQLFRERCRRASELRVSELTADFDFARAAADPEYRQRLRFLLRGCYGILEEFRMTLRFPVRIDFAAGEDGAPYVRLLRELLYPHLELALEIDPAAPPGGTRLPETLFFHSSCWRLRCGGLFDFGWFAPFAAGAEEYTVGPRLVVVAPSVSPEEAFLTELAARLRGEATGAQQELFPPVPTA